jgi:hypothetical protein
VPLEQTVVFRQLEEGSRFSRFDPTDGVIALVPFNVHYVAATCLGWSLIPPFVTLGAMCLGVYFLRVRFPEGVGPVLQVLMTPHHLSALAEDVLLPHPYPPGQRAGSVPLRHAKH